MFGKRKSKEVLLTCPSCDHQQNEPRHALSTFCRECGEHFRIKDGKAVQSAGASLSGITSFRELGEVEVVSNKPVDRHRRAIDIQPAPKREKVEFETPIQEEKSVPLTSETDVAETGAETWLESDRKSSTKPVPAADEPSKDKEQEKKEAVTKSEVSEKKIEKEQSTTPIKSKTRKKRRGKKQKEVKSAKVDEPSKAKTDDAPKDDYDDFATNPIALAAAVTAKKQKAVLDLEVAQAKKFEDASLGADAQPKEALATGSMEALLKGISTDGDITSPIAEEVKIEAEPAPAPAPQQEDKVDVDLNPAKMPSDFAAPSKKDKNPNTRPIRCFKCNHRQMVSIAASSTQCGRCSVYISLSDYDIKSAQSQTIRTRGNVTIHRRGSLMGCDIACHDLTVVGKISGSVDCSGNALFKNSGKVMGPMHCKHLQVDKKCELTFPHGVIAESADISGIVNGNITCSGTVKIHRTGAVNGDATAKAIVLKDGGILSGQMSIQHDVDIELPLKRAYDPSIIR